MYIVQHIGCKQACKTERNVSFMTYGDKANSFLYEYRFFLFSRAQDWDVYFRYAIYNIYEAIPVTDKYNDALTSEDWHYR